MSSVHRILYLLCLIMCDKLDFSAQIFVLFIFSKLVKVQLHSVNHIIYSMNVGIKYLGLIVNEF
jgi:hypothetical protein